MFIRDSNVNPVFDQGVYSILTLWMSITHRALAVAVPLAALAETLSLMFSKLPGVCSDVYQSATAV
jgi:hypothetical protein